MTPYSAIRTPRSQNTIRAARICSLQGVSPVLQTGPGGAGSGLGVGTVLASGIAAMNAAVVVKIVASGEPNDGSAQFQLSLDGGATWNLPALITTTPIVVSATGSTVTFVAAPAGTGGSFVAGELYAFTVTIPVWDSTAWQEFSAPRRLIDLEVEDAAILDQAIADMAAGGFLRDAAGPWLDLLVSDVYDETRNPSVFAQGYLTLQDTAGVGPVTIAAGSMWARDATGLLRYVNLSAGTLPLNGVLTLLFSAESPGVAYNLGNGAVAQLVTPIPGVTVVAEQYVSAMQQSRLAAPALTLAWNGLPAGSFDVRIEITTAGTPGSAGYRYSLDGGSTWAASNQTVPSAYADWGVTGLRLTAASGTYNLGDVFTCIANASWISQTGVDVESDDRLRTRCQKKWPTLSQSDAVPAQAWESRALDASDLVTQAIAQEDLTTPGQTDLYLAGPDGGVTSDVVSAVDNACQPFIGLSEILLTQSATTFVVSVTGTIRVKAGQMAAAQAAGLTALAEYAAGCPIGGYDIGGGVTGVSREEIIACLLRGSQDSPVTGTAGGTFSAPAVDAAMSIPQALVLDVSGIAWSEV